MSVVVPGLVRGEDLHEADAPLDQASGQQALRAVLLRRGIIEAVEPTSRLGLAADVESLLGGRLHPRRQLISGDPGFEVGFAGMSARWSRLNLPR